MDNPFEEYGHYSLPFLIEDALSAKDERVTEAWQDFLAAVRAVEATGTAALPWADMIEWHIKRAT